MVAYGPSTVENPGSPLVTQDFQGHLRGFQQTIQQQPVVPQTDCRLRRTTTWTVRGALAPRRTPSREEVPLLEMMTLIFGNAGTTA